MRRLRYNVAASLDGFIAGPGGEFDWITSDPTIDFKALFAQFDLFVMGRKTFEAVNAQGDLNPTRGRNVLVVSRTLRQDDHRQVKIVSQAPQSVIAQHKESAGKDIWLFGGAQLARALFDAKLVDTVEVAVMPVLLRRGIRIIPEGDCIKLAFQSVRSLPSGIQLLSYAVDYGA